MSTLFQYLAEQGGVLLAAATGLLAIGCLGVALQRSPIHRQRAGEMAILGVWAALILACVPLPRYRLPDLWPGGPVTPDSLRPAEAVESPPPVFEPLVELPLPEVTVEDAPPMPADRLPPEVGTAADPSGVAVVMLPEPREPPAVVHPEPLPNTQVLQPTLDGDRTTVTVGRSSSVAAAPAFDVRYLLSIAYIAGMLGCVVWLALGRVLLVRMLRSARPPEPWLREVYQQLPFARRQRPRLLISERCTRALSFGIWRPTIVLSGAACRADRAAGLRYVLLHELAHARQRDGWGHLLFNAAFPLLYFHPLYWWIRSRAYLAAELIADDWAAGRRTKESYVEALIALAKGGGRGQLAYSSSPQIFGSRSQFYRRMQMLLDRETRLTRRCSPLWRLIYPIACLAAVVLVAGAAGVRPAEAQSEETLPPIEPVADASPSGDEATEPAADADLILDETDPNVVEADLIDDETSQLKMDRDALRAERDQLEKQLKDLADAVAQLKNELAVLKQQRAVSQPTGRRSRRTPSPAVQPQPVQAPPAAPRRGIPAGYFGVKVRIDPGANSAIRTIRPGDRVDVFSANQRVFENLEVHTMEAIPGRLGLDSADEYMSVSLLVGMGQAGKLLRATKEGEVRLQKRKQVLETFPPSVAEHRPPEGTRLDLVRLATSYADAVGELEIAQLEYEGRKKLVLADPRAVPARELAIAEIRLKSARRKVDLLRSIAESALMATQADMEVAKTRLDQATKKRRDASTLEAIRSEVVRAESRLRILKSIFESAGR